MRDEAAFKKHFKKSVSAQGGFSISLAAPMLPGTPDLYCAMPGFAPVLLEAKWMKELAIKTDKQIPLTPMQKHTIDNCNNVFPGIAHCLIGYKYNNHYYATLLPTDGRIILGCGAPVRISKQSELFDVKLMFELYVPKMNYVYEPTKSLTDHIKFDNVPVPTILDDEETERKILDAMAIPPH